jgi:CubicO group peptidase (beta-lactamase class C family)
VYIHACTTHYPVAGLIEKIVTADPSDNPLDIDSLLIARHGKLVLEEYFHGFDKEEPHDMRSASKTFAPILVGIARELGFTLSSDTPIYPLFSEDKPFPHWDPRKSHVTLKALMTMTSGFACDDNDEASPGNEDNMQSQTAQPDWYKYTLDLPMAAEPDGRHAVYCSADLNLVGGVVAHATDSWLPEFFDRYLARPLQFGTYHMNLMPTGEAYMGGGLYLRPRDELKLGQLYLSGGIWHATRIVSEDWIRQSTIAYSTFDPQTSYDAPHEYGFGWHINRCLFPECRPRPATPYLSLTRHSRNCTAAFLTSKSPITEIMTQSRSEARVVRRNASNSQLNFKR